MNRVRVQPLTTRPRVSVVIPCYNYGHYLPDAVASALGQPGVEVDVLVVDDASPDGSVEVAHRLAAADPRVRVLAHPVNRGHIATYNDGLAEVDGDHVVLLSADDLLAPGSLARAAALLEAHPDVAFTYGYAESFAEAPPPARTAVRSWSVWSGERWAYRLSRHAHNVVVNPEVVMRGSIMDKLVGYDPALPHAADLDLWIRAAQLGSVGRVNGPHQAFYRAHGANMHLTDYGSLLYDLRERLTVFDAAFAPDGRSDGSTRRLAARRALAREALRLAWRARLAGGGSGADTVEAFTDWARDTWPGVVRTPTWRAVTERREATPPEWERAAASLYLRGRSHLWWRRWRRFGL
ncbi:glycosyltransferase family 2 protein [Geodermatophilus sp. SYSU D01119]